MVRETQLLTFLESVRYQGFNFGVTSHSLNVSSVGCVFILFIYNKVSMWLVAVNVFTVEL